LRPARSAQRHLRQVADLFEQARNVEELHSSSTRPSRQRLTIRPQTSMSLPVGAAPMSSPSWRPRSV
jgi:hypothetical protein